MNALLATVSTPLSAAPVIVATRLRKGSAHSARGAARLVADAIKTTPGVRRDRAGGASARDSAFYAARVIAAVRRAQCAFSITARKDPAVDRGDRRDPRGCVDADPLPERHLR